MKTIITGFILMMVLGLSGCETMKGLGQDIQSAGKALEKKAGE